MKEDFLRIIGTPTRMKRNLDGQKSKVSVLKLQNRFEFSTQVGSCYAYRVLLHQRFVIPQVMHTASQVQVSIEAFFTLYPCFSAFTCFQLPSEGRPALVISFFYSIHFLWVLGTNINIIEGASDQSPIWIFNFWPYGQPRALQKKNWADYEQLLRAVFSCFNGQKNV